MPKSVLRNMERDADAGSGPGVGACRSCWHANPAQAKAAREGSWIKTHIGAADTEPADSTTTEPPTERHTHPCCLECKFQEGAGITQLVSAMRAPPHWGQ